MNFFKFNITNSYASVIQHKKLTTPVKGVESCIDIAKIKKGDLILLMVGSEIKNIAIASKDVYTGHVSYYDLIPAFTVTQLFTLDIEILPTKRLDSDAICKIFKYSGIASKGFCDQLFTELKEPELIASLNSACFDME